MACSGYHLLRHHRTPDVDGLSRMDSLAAGISILPGKSLPESRREEMERSDPLFGHGDYIYPTTMCLCANHGGHFAAAISGGSVLSGKHGQNPSVVSLALG